MLHTKRLAYGEGRVKKPEITRTLFFSALCGTALTLMVSCAHADAVSRLDSTSSKKNVPAWVPDKPKKEGLQGKCGADFSRALRKGEKVVESKCTDNYEFVLTSENLRVFPRQTSEAQQEGGISVSFSNMSIEMKDLLRSGVIDWEATDKSCYFLLRNGTMVFIPMDMEEKSVTTYKLQFDVAGMDKDSMAYFKGNIVLADPRGYVILLPDSEEGQWTRVDLGGPQERMGLTVKGSKLFVTNAGAPDTEIEIGKDGPRIVGP
ncbi:MAG: hypothetical protein PHF60_01590 [Candidatus ainarchaeum sp.]|nr:hypothetical protein [Candidatus ainarchaeum sp.]